MASLILLVTIYATSWISLLTALSDGSKKNQYSISHESYEIVFGV